MWHSTAPSSSSVVSSSACEATMAHAGQCLHGSARSASGTFTPHTSSSRVVRSLMLARYSRTTFDSVSRDIEYPDRRSNAGFRCVCVTKAAPWFSSAYASKNFRSNQNSSWASAKFATRGDDAKAPKSAAESWHFLYFLFVHFKDTSFATLTPRTWPKAVTYVTSWLVSTQ